MTDLPGIDVALRDIKGRHFGVPISVLAIAGDDAQGIAVIDSATSEKGMEPLWAAGVVGASITDLPGSAVGLARIEDVDARTAATG